MSGPRRQPPSSTRARNANAFAAIHAVLAAGQMVLIFPEGRSWDEPRLAPIKTGTARMALSARDAGVRGVTIVPIGINYERKDGLRSRVLVEVGEPIAIDALDTGRGGRWTRSRRRSRGDCTPSRSTSTTTAMPTRCWTSRRYWLHDGRDPAARRSGRANRCQDRCRTACRS